MRLQRGPGPFVPGGRVPFSYWLKKFESYTKMAGLSKDAELLGALLSEIGDDIGIQLMGWMDGKSPFDSTYVEVVKILGEAYGAKAMVVAERYKLLKLHQKPGQGLHEFFTEIEVAANTCAFDEVKDVRDMVASMVFIAGLRSETTRDKLLAQEKPQVFSMALLLL